MLSRNVFALTEIGRLPGCGQEHLPAAGSSAGHHRLLIAYV
ncbi:MAG: hypothetical protein WBX07_03115 [Rhodoplanes sp.]|jgi:hypothetical protein